MRLLRFLSNSQRNDNIFVEYEATLQDHEDLDELFRITHPFGIDNDVEKKMFSRFDARAWTLNEVIFFCNSNNLVLQIYSSNKIDKELLIEYGDYPPNNLGFMINTQKLIINNSFIFINQ